MSPPDASVAPRPHTQRFRRSSRSPALSADQKRRQAAVTDAAWRAFRAGNTMASFLNTEDLHLGGRPLDLAIDSDHGLTAVLAALSAMSVARCSPPTGD